uniref:Tetratricopeptide repeat protein 30 n=1 Tax=Polytomella parva TaxID=51329 RepID=A0A7S0YW97_9CHLO|mmetsp:Transcript_7431/g.14623  ORF Transcript_7431/g.14623 Transcript_7431/m.14623 type:complete len:652 (+) Transcript_7431:137-2092(+)|eukprot:CAMPEP_0175056692 /NCGR_PEP_ID=MMETSP0052_2-20121109/10824_1 /TAXON_ID=51329 ORGANISM="Polytomella parva, Strain SAG 63-3" /NCGR_SAMPLE_ID=MMETSP0052_2 /ASSEMBLY_ACC=CAM_ASM_000194 /LENGTH=651 /DNA_ID=CAMNT_0016321771 /DNA_START=70 /DNA_END=2025 /DNA_ORIENTATION=+
MSSYYQQQQRSIADGQYTQTIYNLIKDQKFHEAISILQQELQNLPESRAALSLLGYCHYYIGQFEQASQMYEQLVKLFPDNDDYKMYYAQSIYKAGMYAEASKAALKVEEKQKQVTTLLVACAYEQEDLPGCRRQLDKCAPEDLDTLVNTGCVLFKEGHFESARQKFTEAMSSLGYQPELLYNIALCYYKTKQFGNALKNLAEIIERGVREHPELSVGSNTDGVDVRSVGNSQVLKETSLIEAFNLKAAIEYSMKNFDAAREALTDMPPRSEEELDPVTLHNTALINMDSNPTASFKKLNFLLQNPPFPPETFGNLLLLYCKPQHAFFDLAADVLAENPQYASRFLSPDLHDFLQAAIMRSNRPEEAFRRFDELSTRHVEALRKLTKQIQDARIARENETIRKAITAYDDALEAYVPVLMAMAAVYWDRDLYSAVEKVFRQSAEFCSEHEVWKLNVAHTFYMQDNHFKEAIRYYEPTVKKNADNLLSVTAIVLANLCVSYIMTSQNEEAEELMRKVEKEEERAMLEEPGKACFHLCIINLVIGTLYCAKGNYEFGISRIIKSLEPYDKKLETDTWYYAKRCFLSLIEMLAKHMTILKDVSFAEIMGFLTEAEKHGRDIKTNFAQDGRHVISTRTVSSEARVLKKMFLKLRD